MATLIPAAGPLDPSSSRPLAGVLGGTVFAYEFAADLGEQRVELPVSFGPVGPDTELHWAFYADDPGAITAPYASLAVTVDLVFADGSRLGGAVDRYGFALDAESQFAARWSMPEQWNANTVSLARWAGQQLSRAEVVLGAESLRGANGQASGFVEVLLVERSRSADRTPSEWVDTRRGTQSGSRFSRGNTIPAVAVPHGFNFVTPATDATDSRWPYRPYLHDDERGRRLQAIQFSHQPSPWIGDRGVLQLMPFTEEPRSDRGARSRWIVPGSEVALPHRYAADLSGLSVEVAATDHAAAFRVHGAGPVGFVVDQLTNDGSLALEVAVDRARFSGWVPEGSAEWGNAPRMYFAGVSVGPVTECAVLDDAGRERVAGALIADDQLEVRIATSFISIEQAWHSLELEAPNSLIFNDIQDSARSAWDELLRAISIPPESDDARALAHEELLTTIYSDLYRLHLYPNSAAENVGTHESPDWHYADVFASAEAHGETQTGSPVVPGKLVVNNGYWDTYRTAWPMLHLLEPALAGDLLEGQLEQYRRGGFMTRWSAPGYVDCMVGTSSDQIFADAERWDVPGFDDELAFESGWRNACEPSPLSRSGRKGIERARFTGYVAREVHEGLSWSLENAISDAGLARFAERLAVAFGEARYSAYARYFANRALSYRQLFEPESGFFRSRDAGGDFAAEPLDPRVWGGDYVETNAWGMAVTPVHDGPGLAELHGGPAGLGEQLDRLFAEPETARDRFGGSYESIIHEHREARAMRSGMCALSNQPAHHIPFMYVHSSEPWRAAPLVHELAERLFAGGHIGQGYPGDEDNGEMSAWWIWAAMGLYPLELGSGELLVGSPLLDEVTVRRTGKGQLRIRAHRESPKSRFVNAVRENGALLERAVLNIDALAGDCELEIFLVDQPPVDSPLWRAEPTEVAAWCPDLTRPELAIAADSVRHPEWAFDNGAASGDRGVALEAGEWIGQAFEAPVPVADVTVTVVDGVAAGAFVIESSADGETWQGVALSHDEALPANRTTPFTLIDVESALQWRLRAQFRLTLRQLELFNLR